MLVDWLGHPPSDKGIHFADDAGSWTFHSYAGIAERANAMAARLREEGAERGDVVSLILPTCVHFPAAFFGALLIGTVPNPIVPPSYFRPREYREHLGALLNVAQSAVVVTDTRGSQLVGEVLAETGSAARMVIADEVAMVADPVARRSLLGPALLQFTSGSTGTPRGIAISEANLMSNLTAVHRLGRFAGSDQLASWLPLYHDMGLVGCLLAPMVAGAMIWLMRPEQFLRQPTRMVRKLGDGVTLTAGTPFGYRLMATRTTDADLAGVDLTDLRAAVVGAERVDVATLDLFSDRFAPCGFRREAWLPAYGLAEATLLVSASPRDRAPVAIRVDWSETEFGGRVAVKESRLLDDYRSGNDAVWMVGCGEVVADTTVTVVDAEGRQLPDGALGELMITGPAVGRRYHATGQADSRFQGGSVRTGDAGFWYGGELYVLGRMGDSICIRGRMVFVEELEACLLRVPGCAPGSALVLAGESAGAGLVVCVVEGKPPWLSEAAAALRGRVGRMVEIRVVSVRRGGVLRTSSGKPRRRQMWQMLVPQPNGFYTDGATTVLELPAEQTIRELPQSDSTDVRELIAESGRAISSDFELVVDPAESAAFGDVVGAGCTVLDRGVAPRLYAARALTLAVNRLIETSAVEGDWRHLRLAAQEFHFGADLRLGDRLFGTATVRDSGDYGLHNAVRLEIMLRLSSGDVAVSMDTIVTIGQPKFTGRIQLPAPAAPALDEVAATSVQLAADLPLRYAQVSGDWNPIHIDADFARSVGLPGIVVHGIATIGVAATSAATALGLPIESMTRLRGRLSRPVQPTSELAVVIHRTRLERMYRLIITHNAFEVVKDAEIEFAAPAYSGASR